MAPCRESGVTELRLQFACRSARRNATKGGRADDGQPGQETLEMAP
jgi:hypothetical protein